MKFFYLLIAVSAAMMCGCSRFDTRNIPAVKNFDLKRYCGNWYEIARLPNWFERGMTDVSANYTLLPDGMVKVRNRGVRNGKVSTIDGKARFAGTPDCGELEVSFQWPFRGAYRVIALDKDYSTAVVCGKSKKYLWILSRKPQLPEAELIRIIEFLRHHSFNVSELEYSQKVPSALIGHTSKPTASCSTE